MNKQQKAGREVRWALERGDLVKPEQCEECGKDRKLDAHHDDYDSPLEVKWLCRSCHKKLHWDRGDYDWEEYFMGESSKRRSIRMETLLKPGYIAEVLDVRPRTVVRWINDGKLEGVKVGRVWRVRAIDLYKFLNS